LKTASTPSSFNSAATKPTPGTSTQDTFVRAFQALGQFDVRQSFAPWIFTIARRKCIDHFRTRKPLTEERPPEETNTDDPAALLEKQEEAQSLWAVARQSLPPAQFQALWLYYVEEMSGAEIAAALGKTPTHIKVMLLRARRSLADKLPRSKTHDAPSRAIAAQPQEAMGETL
jgi:RNA polymerase sigma-70 factor (ECF subfamily)